MSRATVLRESVKRRFYPFAEARGFVREKPTDPHFTSFRRFRDESVDYFEVQWDKYWQPYFVLNFGRTSATEASKSAGRTSESARESIADALSGRLQRSRGGSLSCWFHLRTPWRRFWPPEGGIIVPTRWSTNSWRRSRSSKHGGEPRP